MSEKRFPILNEDWDIPWSVAEKVYEGYVIRYGTKQTLERIAERGGFGKNELDMFLPCWIQEIKITEVGELYNDLWGLLYPDDPKGWDYPRQIYNHIRIALEGN